MTTSHITQFLLEATVPDKAHEPLGRDCLYGLYTSWCSLHNIKPFEDRHFRDALRRRGMGPDGSRRRMIGPAAVDYLMASYPEDL